MTGESERTSGRRPLSILVYAPILNAGGGTRLLRRILPEFLGHPELGRVRLLTAATRAEAGEAPQFDIPGLEVERVARGWLGAPASGGDPPHSGRLLRYLKYAGAPLLRTGRRRWAEWLSGGSLSARALGRLLPRERWAARFDRGFDLLWAFWPHRLPPPASHVPVVCTVQDLIFFDFPEILGPVETQAEHARLGRWLASSRIIVVSSGASAEKLSEHFGVDPAKVRIVRHAYFLGDASAPVPPRPARIPLSVSKYLLVASNTTIHKNHANLLVAWSRFSKRREWTLVLAGPGTDVLAEPGRQGFFPSDHGSSLKALARRLGLSPGEDVLVLGEVTGEEILGAIGNAAGLVMPSFAEGGGSFPVEEALTLGVPVISSDIGPVREQTEGRTAEILWFDPYSPDQLRAALERLASDEPALRAKARRARSDPRPGWSVVADQYARVFSEAAGRAEAALVP
jgi:glycosyltransferase involved in cell wall biosynthesis